MGPALVTVPVFQIVGIGNDDVPPPVMLSDWEPYPITLGLDSRRSGTGRPPEPSELTDPGACCSRSSRPPAPRCCSSGSRPAI
ncbi:hypothetical protein GCM10009809_11790 [Isoptericola hypogeus]|uniref:Uncharacterized protein n=1 Tax=Isoptericola hypogeus TaxID=300179 RepID=A0ABP4V4Q6_9MICO